MVTDTSGYNPPAPTYNITYNDLTDTQIYFSVNIQNTSTLPANIVSLVQNAVVAQFSGQNGAPRARSGSLILASQYYAPIIAAGPTTIQLMSVYVGVSAPAQLASVTMGIDQEPVIAAANVTVNLI